MSLRLAVDSQEFSPSSQTRLQPVEIAANKSAAAAVAQFSAIDRGGLPPRALRRVLDYIEAHLDKSIGIQALAEIAGLSKFHFVRTFKRSKGMTPHDYMVFRRVRRTQLLLADTDLPLSEIALASGFSDQSHCARRFREEIGISPSQYRRSMR